MNATHISDGAAASAPASLTECLLAITDPRVDRTRLHNFGDILAIAACCMLCGGESFYDMEDFGLAKEAWFRTFLELPDGIPSHDTFNRVFAALDPAKFNACFLRWTEGLRKVVEGDIVSLDGKALRRAAGKTGVPFIVNAWSSANGLAPGQVKVDDKSNEITAVPGLLDALLLKGCIVTLDAMGCQRATAAKIADAGADYVISSLPVDARKALETCRAHWNIENQLHWRLDVQFNEDQCRARTKDAAENLAILRRIAMNMLNNEKTKKRGIKGKQRNASWDCNYLMKLLRSDAGPACHLKKN